MQVLLQKIVAKALPERHRGRDTFDLMSLVIGMMVTFTALIPSLLMAFEKTGFDTAAYDRQHDALVLMELDACLRDLGPRRMLPEVTSAAIRQV